MEEDKVKTKPEGPCLFFKKSKRSCNNVKKIGDNLNLNNDNEEENTKNNVVKPERPRKQLSAISSTTSLKRKKELVILDKDRLEEEEEEKDELKTAIAVNYRSNIESKLPKDLATKTLDIDTPRDQDAQAIFERQMNLNKEREGKADDGLYRGQTGYTQYITKQDTTKGKASSNLVRQGPFRASENIRVTTRWDYQPDICKDYKDTGFCGFGDSCKFVHDRSDYKYGWELERDYEAGLLNTTEPTKFEIHSSDEEKEEELPFACFICRNSFNKPIKTKCKHYFCEQCALDHYKKSHRCFICGQQTYGIFVTAKEIMLKQGKVSKPDNSKTNNEEKSTFIPTDGEIVNEIVNEIENVIDEDKYQSEEESPISD